MLINTKRRRVGREGKRRRHRSAAQTHCTPPHHRPGPSPDGPGGPETRCSQCDAAPPTPAVRDGGNQPEQMLRLVAYNPQRFPDEGRFAAAIAAAAAAAQRYFRTQAESSRPRPWDQGSMRNARRVVALLYDLNASPSSPRSVMGLLLGLPPPPALSEVQLRRAVLDRPVTLRDAEHPHLIGMDSAGTPYYIRRAQLQLAFLNPQGNFDAANTGLGEHADFGGQLVYVREVAEALGRIGVSVDIVTRRFADPRWPSFDAPEEILTEPRLDDPVPTGRVRILRIGAGPRDFVPKEGLWPHLEGWMENVAAFYEGEGQLPHATTGHYGDGGLAGARLAKLRGLPLATFTAHSLGAQKLDGLMLQDKDLSPFNFEHRIGAERVSMATARRLVTSTRLEQDEQYGHPLYLGAVDLQRDAHKFRIIRPGVNLEVFGADKVAANEQETLATLQAAIARDIPPERRHLPIVIAAGRLDAKKNHINIVRAFAEHPHLRRNANLLLLLKGGKDCFYDPEGTLAGSELAVARPMRDIMARKHMLGQCVIIPGLANIQPELAAVYRHLGRTRQGIFCLAADIEPFGLMILEAMCGGVPAVATHNGGPNESLQSGRLRFGMLIDPKSPASIGAALNRLAADPEAWLQLRDRGQRWVLEQYSWDRAATRYRDVVLEALTDPA